MNKNTILRLNNIRSNNVVNFIKDLVTDTIIDGLVVTKYKKWIHISCAYANWWEIKQMEYIAKEFQYVSYVSCFMTEDKCIFYMADVDTVVRELYKNSEHIYEGSLKELELVLENKLKLVM